MGASDSKPTSQSPSLPTPTPAAAVAAAVTPADQSATAAKAKCKPCCACPDTRKARDECVFDNGEEKCADLIKAHQDCMRAQGFNI
ncbi:hypothetical protein HDU87_004044 [Geranomyces variabilis]|uniref:Cytochrome c oxidase copper chaperone n=1 Tax=Geranomyces variabilis TaxID=109894 RepID=A0AAD5TVS0_9FUNG|nr:hypothetical protein HDU87_004044 [Geranomyces variabilis]